MPSATARPGDCPFEEIREAYLSGRWTHSERLIDRCLRANPLATPARLILVRIYLMRAYAAKEPRWLDEARRQLKMAEGDPVHHEEAQKLLLLIDQPTVE